MKKTIFILFLIIVMTASITLSLYIISAAFSGNEEQRQGMKRRFRPAEYCRQCHEKEYTQWTNSGHSQSLQSVDFQRFFKLFLSDTSDKNRRICLRCHAPAAVFNSDLDIKESDNASPVSCEICHSLTGYDSNFELTFDLEGKLFSTGDAMLGTGHNVYKKPEISNSSLCEPCHIAVNPLQKNYICSQDILYEKWKSITGRTEQCQDCHMRDSSGGIDHTFRGISDPELLKTAFDVRWDVFIEPMNYKVKLIIHNTRIGHIFPAGITIRRIVIEAALLNSDSKILNKQEAFLGKIYQDSDGIWPVMGWQAHEIKMDNAIAPLESRMLVFNLPAAAGADSISLRIVYSRYPGDSDPLLIFIDQKKI